MKELIAAASRLGLTGGELALVRQGNDAVRHVIDTVGAVAVRTYRLYQKEIC